MWEIWANLLLPRACKSCPKSKKSPNLVTLRALLAIYSEMQRLMMMMNTHHKEKAHCTAGLWFNWIASFDPSKNITLFMLTQICES